MDAYPGPSLQDMHYEAIQSIDRALPSDERWRLYVAKMRALAQSYPRWRIREHWLINPDKGKDSTPAYPAAYGYS